MTTFRVRETDLGEQIDMIVSETEVWAVPKDPANSDYQRYLRWLENPDAEENGTIS